MHNLNVNALELSSNLVGWFKMCNPLVTFVWAIGKPEGMQ